MPVLSSESGGDMTGNTYNLLMPEVREDDDGKYPKKPMILTQKDFTLNHIDFQKLPWLECVKESLEIMQSKRKFDETYYGLLKMSIYLECFSGLFREFEQVKGAFIKELENYKSSLQVEGDIVKAENILKLLNTTVVSAEVDTVIEKLARLETAKSSSKRVPKHMREDECMGVENHRLDIKHKSLAFKGSREFCQQIDRNTRHDLLLSGYVTVRGPTRGPALNRLQHKEPPLISTLRMEIRARQDIVKLAIYNLCRYFKHDHFNKWVRSGELGFLFTSDYFSSSENNAALIPLLQRGADLTHALVNISDKIKMLLNPYLPVERTLNVKALIDKFESMSARYVRDKIFSKSKKEV